MIAYNSNVPSNYLVLDAFLPKNPTEVTVFRSRMDMIIQERKCVSLVKEPDEEKRCLQWVMEEIDILWKVVSKVLYRSYFISITQRVLILCYRNNHLNLIVIYNT